MATKAKRMPNQAPSPTHLTIATRGSRLALWQAHFVQDQLAQTGVTSELVLIETQGDREQSVTFAQMQGQGFFTKAVQDAVLDGRADLAVHSLKDLPSAVCPGLTLAAIPQRVDPRDTLLIRPSRHTADSPRLPLPEGATLGTSAARRRAQIAHLRPDIALQTLRGNVPTRLQKLRDGEYDAILLAAAGLKRLALDLSDLHVLDLSPNLFVPAPGQGALGIECREDDQVTRDALAAIHDADAATTVTIERTLMAKFDGGCQLALGAMARRIDDAYELIAWYEGTPFHHTHSSPEQLIEEAYQSLRTSS
jgi:hydroxymethylbilane synthase